MNSSILHFAKWICRQLTRPEFDSLSVIFQEVQGGSREDFIFKEEKPPPNYRDFRQEPVRPRDKGGCAPPGASRRAAV